MLLTMDCSESRTRNRIRMQQSAPSSPSQSSSSSSRMTFVHQSLAATQPRMPYLMVCLILLAGCATIGCDSIINSVNNNSNNSNNNNSNDNNNNNTSSYPEWMKIDTNNGRHRSASAAAAAAAAAAVGELSPPSAGVEAAALTAFVTPKATLSAAAVLSAVPPSSLSMSSLTVSSPSSSASSSSSASLLSASSVSTAPATISALSLVSASAAALASIPMSLDAADTLDVIAAAALLEPYLDGYATTNVTTQIGTHAYLPCRVNQLGNKSVSWIRVRDGHILTVDRAVFIADQRFLALKQPDKFWTLQIKYVQARDAGAYECQVSTEPKVSARVHLQVVVPRTEILGDPDRYVKAGSTVVLRCIVRGAIEPPTFIMWYHGAEQLAADSRRHRTQVDRNLPEVEGDARSTIGSLIIESAKKRDTGNYTCSPSNSPSVTVTLNVINGESSASAVTSAAAATRAYTVCVLSLLSGLVMIGAGRTATT